MSEVPLYPHFARAESQTFPRRRNPLGRRFWEDLVRRETALRLNDVSES